MKLYDIPNNLKVMTFVLNVKAKTYFVSGSEIEIYLFAQEKGFQLFMFGDVLGCNFTISILRYFRKSDFATKFH